MVFHGDDDHSADDVDPCVYVTFPPYPMSDHGHEHSKYCFPSPIETALFGFQNGYSANRCQRPPKKMCRKFDWYEAKRKEERSGVWAWKNGRNVFSGDGNVKAGKKCHLDSDCEMYPLNLCFGDDVDSSICANGTKVELGGKCSFDDQCQEGMNYSSYQCNNDKATCKEPPKIEVKCIDRVCLARSTCRKSSPNTNTSRLHLITILHPSTSLSMARDFSLKKPRNCRHSKS